MVYHLVVKKTLFSIDVRWKWENYKVEPYIKWNQTNFSCSLLCQNELNNEFYIYIMSGQVKIQSKEIASDSK